MTMRSDRTLFAIVFSNLIANVGKSSGIRLGKITAFCARRIRLRQYEYYRTIATSPSVAPSTP